MRVSTYASIFLIGVASALLPATSNAQSQADPYAVDEHGWPIDPKAWAEAGRRLPNMCGLDWLMFGGPFSDYASAYGTAHRKWDRTFGKKERDARQAADPLTWTKVGVVLLGPSGGQTIDGTGTGILYPPGGKGPRGRGAGAPAPGTLVVRGAPTTSRASAPPPANSRAVADFRLARGPFKPGDFPSNARYHANLDYPRAAADLVNEARASGDIRQLVENVIAYRRSKGLGPESFADFRLGNKPMNAFLKQDQSPGNEVSKEVEVLFQLAKSGLVPGYDYRNGTLPLQIRHKGYTYDVGTLKQNGDVLLTAPGAWLGEKYVEAMTEAATLADIRAAGVFANLQPYSSGNNFMAQAGIQAQTGRVFDLKAFFPADSDFAAVLSRVPVADKDFVPLYDRPGYIKYIRCY